jgi:ribosomal protein L29
MFFSEISSLTAKELVKMKKELQTSMFEARMKNSLGQLANQMVIRSARKDIARINTALTGLVSGKAASSDLQAKSSSKTGAKAKKKLASPGKKG